MYHFQSELFIKSYPLIFSFGRLQMCVVNVPHFVNELAHQQVSSVVEVTQEEGGSVDNWIKMRKKDTRCRNGAHG